MKIETTSRKRTIGYAVVYAGAGFLVVALITVLVQLRVLAGDNHRTIELIEDCTIAGGKCYERGQANQAGAIEVLNEFTTYVIACADQPGVQTVADLRACAITKAQKAD